MGLSIIYGSSYSKRTGYLFDRTLQEAEAHPEKRYILLVPEQASLSVQKEMILRSRTHSLFNIDVLTFNRLAYRVFEELNEREENVLDDAGKSMLLRLVMRREQEHASLLKRNLNRKGFVKEVKSLISELVQYNVSPEKLRESLDSLEDHPYLKDKVGQIADIYASFMGLLKKDYRMSEERMTLLSRKIGEIKDVEKTTFILEGFTGFTPPQTEVLRVLLKKAEEVVFSCTLGSYAKPEEQKNEEDLFYMTCHSAAVLKEQAIMAGIPYRETIITDIAGTDPRNVSGGRPAPGLLHLEEHLFVYPEVPYERPVPEIQILKTSNRREEAHLVLADILSYIRRGYEYRDLGIIVSDMTGYREELETCFKEAGIPYFYDEGRDLSGDPLFLLVSAVLELVRTDFSYDSAVHLMKNPLMLTAIEKQLKPDDRLSVYERAAECENFLLSSGIRGRSGWTREWKGPKRMAEIRIAAVNEFKDSFLSLVLPVYDALSSDTTVSDKLNAFRDFLAVIRADESMKLLAKEAEDAGDMILKREYEEALESLTELFSLTEKILGSEALDHTEFTDVLTDGMSGLRLGMQPPSLDRLVIGDLKRTRLSGIKKLYIMGVNEGLFPAASPAGGLLTDMDREILKAHDIPLSPGVREDSFNLQLYIYLALTCPKEALMLTCPLADRDGKILTESPVLSHIRALFPKMEAADFREAFSTGKQGFRRLASDLQKARERLERGNAPEVLPAYTRGLYRALSEDEGQERMALIGKGLFSRYLPEELSKSLTRSLYKDQLSVSVSRLEQYAGCAYRHFLSYGLKLQERQEFELDAADFGTLFHECIDTFFRKLKEQGLSWNDLDTEKRTVLAEESVREVTSEYSEAYFSENARNGYLLKRVLRLTERTLWALKKQWDLGSFEKTETEVPFYGGPDFRALQMNLGDGLSLSLRGRIDRLDLSDDGSRVYVRVIDYKSGHRELDFTKIYYGLQLQLLLYLEAARELVRRRDPAKEIVPAGIYYYQIQDPVVDKDDKKDPEEQILDKLRLNGITNVREDSLRITEPGLESSSRVIQGLGRTKDGFRKSARIAGGEDFDSLLAFARGKTASLAGNILDGNIAVDPYVFGQEDGCQYCAFNGVCGYDDRIPGFKKRRLYKKELDDLLKETEDGSI
ncbi:MAG: PD-(D/E)XK nuclease family protein [Lachnospiraceae bacterium]|nr:PD-(D/E)XK nuclease family protein [Lachnospiraceae bacterium]